MPSTKIAKRVNPKSPAIPAKDKSVKLQEAYETLGVTEQEYNSVPKITPILKSVPGGIKKCIEYLRLSEEIEAVRWLGIYDSLLRQHQTLLPFEAICVAANIQTKRMLEIVTGACFEYSDATSKLLSKAAKPQLIKKTVELAKGSKEDPQGSFSDRKMILQHEGYAPIPKTQIVSVQGNMSVDSHNQSISIGELAGFDRTMGRINDRFNERLGIGDGGHVDEEDNTRMDGSASDNKKDSAIGDNGDPGVFDNSVDTNINGDDNNNVDEPDDELDDEPEWDI